jgi:hypothetical protein
MLCQGSRANNTENENAKNQMRPTTAAGLNETNNITHGNGSGYRDYTDSNIRFARNANAKEE